MKKEKTYFLQCNKNTQLGGGPDVMRIFEGTLSGLTKHIKTVNSGNYSYVIVNFKTK